MLFGVLETLPPLKQLYKHITHAFISLIFNIIFKFVITADKYAINIRGHKTMHYFCYMPDMLNTGVFYFLNIFMVDADGVFYAALPSKS